MISFVILSDNYDIAVKKIKKAEETSNLDSELGEDIDHLPKRLGKRPLRYESSSEDDDLSDKTPIKRLARPPHVELSTADDYGKYIRILL